MNKIYYLMGKSASGKDTIFKRLRKKNKGLKTVVLYTTRPMREKEIEGVEYHFLTDAQMDQFVKEEKVIELRAYHTMHGIWRYATIDDGQIDLSRDSYLMMGTLESYESLRGYYGEDSLVPLYIEVPDGIRLRRALQREERQEKPKYQELCRRFLADAEDFSEKKLRQAKINIHYSNENMVECIRKITEVINHGEL